MKDPKLPADIEQMFEHARAEAPVDRAMLARAWTRVEADRGRRRSSLSWLLPLAAAGVAVAIYARGSETPGGATRSAPAPHADAPIPQVGLHDDPTNPEPPSVVAPLPPHTLPPPDVRPDRSVARAPELDLQAGTRGEGRLASRAPEDRAQPEEPPTTLAPDLPLPEVSSAELAAVEPSIEVPPHRGAAPLAKRPYRPRAIREFQDVDWPRLASEELPRAVREIVERRDEKALLAALDALPLTSSDLILVRGGLRAAAHRCGDALLDFEHVLADPQADALSPRAARGRALCLGAP